MGYLYYLHYTGDLSSRFKPLVAVLACKAEIQTLVALIRSRLQVVLLLLLRHGIPYLRSLLVEVDVEELGTYEEHKVVHAYADQDFVSRSVEGFVVVTVNLIFVSAWLLVADRGDCLRSG